MAEKSNLMKRLEEIQARAEATKKGIPYVPPTEVININKSNCARKFCKILGNIETINEISI